MARMASSIVLATLASAEPPPTCSKDRAAPHRLLSASILLWGRTLNLRGADGRAWLNLATLLRNCDADGMMNALDDYAQMPLDLDAALHAHRPRFALLDAVTSQPALVLPIDEMVSLCRLHGVEEGMRRRDAATPPRRRRDAAATPARIAPRRRHASRNNGGGAHPPR